MTALSVNEINMLHSQNEGFRKQNRELQQNVIDRDCEIQCLKQGLQEIAEIANGLRTKTDYHSEAEVNSDIDAILKVCKGIIKGENK